MIDFERGIRKIMGIRGIRVFFVLGLFLLVTSPALAQNFNVASTYDIADSQAQSGDILISGGAKGIIRTSVSYDSNIFGVLEDSPILVLRDASPSASRRPVVRQGDVIVNVTDFNGPIKKGDYLTSSPVLGKAMRAGQSGYALGIALNDAVFGQNTVSVQGKNVKIGQVKVAIKIEYAELTTVRNTWRLLEDLNAAFFRNVQDPEKFTLTIRYVIAGLIALVAFTIGFITVSRAISKGIEAVGRNPLARQSILASVILQAVIATIGAFVAIIIIYLIIKI